MTVRLYDRVFNYLSRIAEGGQRKEEARTKGNGGGEADTNATGKKKGKRNKKDKPEGLG